MTRTDKLTADRHAILADAEKLVDRIEKDGRQPNVFELRAFDARVAASDRLQAAIDQVRI